MREMLRLLIPLMVLALIQGFAMGQQVKPNTISIKGSVADTLYRRAVPAATVSVYTLQDSSLVAYTLTDQGGIFRLPNIPKDTPLTAVFTFVGYDTEVRRFTARGDEEYDLGRIILNQSENMLQEVQIISIPPVQMNGDTLEFNADAFKLDPNAVAEDLLKKLPGVVVWGDGLITVNGREIQALLVNGKPFFGGDVQVATQNIAKDAIEKIQVYQKSQGRSLMDSIAEINIVMKDPNALGYFGKLAAGAGIRNKTDLVGNPNLFTGRTQATAILGHNNVNKASNDIYVLIRNSTYKGIGINNEYQTDFNKPGDIRSSMMGFFVQHDLVPGVDQIKKNTLKLDYLHHNTDIGLSNENQTITTIGDAAAQIRTSTKNNQDENKNHILNGSYDLSKDNYILHVNAKATMGDNILYAAMVDKVSDDLGDVASSRTQQQSKSESNRGLDISLNVLHRKNRDSKVKVPADWNLQYGISLDDRQHQLNHSSRFLSYMDASANQDFHRDTHFNSNHVGHHVKGSFGNFWNTLFRESFDKTLELVNDLDLDTRKTTNNAYNVDSTSGNRAMNHVLSYHRKEQIVDWRPGIHWQKRFLKHLSDRFDKEAELTVELRYQQFTLKSISDRDFQNFERSYKRLLPRLSYSFSHWVSGEFFNKLNVELASTYEYPSVEDIFPVVDTTNIYNIKYGNESLKPSNKRELSTTFTHKNQKENVFMYGLNLGLGDIRNAFSYYSRIDASGRTSYSYYNLDGSRYISLGANAAKAVKLKHQQLQVKAEANIRLSNTPSYLTIDNDDDVVDMLNDTRSIASSANVNITFTHRELLEMNLKPHMEFYRNIQKAYDNATSNSRYLVESNAVIRPTKRLTVGINARYNRNVFYSSSDDFTICNLRIAKRFLKKDNFEVTLAAYDLLAQNRNISLTTYDNVIVQNRYNALGRHFMLTLSYYPRKFKKKSE